MAAFGKRNGYGQVEPNHLSAQRTGRIYAQLPADNEVFTSGVLENGQFVKYDTLAGKINLTGKGQWVMIFNEVKLYDGYRESYKDYAMKAKDFSDGLMYPRVIVVDLGDIFTTNAIEANVDVATNKYLTVNTLTGFLKNSASNSAPAEDIVFQVVGGKETTMPDGSKALKLQRIK